MKRLLLSSSLAMLAFTGCSDLPTEGAYTDVVCTEIVAEVNDGDFRTGYELTENNELYVAVDPNIETNGLDVSWNVPMDIGIILSVEALGADGNFEAISTIYPSNSFADFKSYDFEPVKTNLLKLKLTEGIARVNEIKVK